MGVSPWWNREFGNAKANSQKHYPLFPFRRKKKPGVAYDGNTRLKLSLVEDLESELPRKLKNSGIERRVNLTEIGIVDVQRIRH